MSAFIGGGKLSMPGDTVYSFYCKSIGTQLFYKAQTIYCNFDSNENRHNLHFDKLPTCTIFQVLENWFFFAVMKGMENNSCLRGGET